MLMHHDDIRHPHFNGDRHGLFVAMLGSQPRHHPGVMADDDVSLLQRVLDIAQRQREPDIQHHRQADDLGAGLEVFEWVAFRHCTGYFFLC